MPRILPDDTRHAESGAPYYVKALAMGIPAIFVGVQIAGWIANAPAIIHGHSDFRAFYTAGYMIRSGHAHSLYDYQSQKAFQDVLISSEQIALPFGHLAHEALLFLPFSWLPYRAAYFAFLVFNLALLAVSYRVFRPRMEKLARIYPWFPAAIFVCFLPVVAALIQGQDSILLMTLLIAAAVSLERDREGMAGILTGLAMFKFQIALPIAVLFVVWKKWRFSAGFALTALAVGFVSLRLVGMAQAREYAQSLASMSLLASADERFKFAIYPDHMANLRGLVYGLAGARIAVSWVRAVTLVVSAAALLWVAVRSSGKKGMDAMLVAIPTSVLVSYHSLIHDMSILLIPLVVALNRYIDAEASGDAGGRLVTRVAALMFAAPIVIAYVPSYFYLVSLPLCVFLVVLVERFRRDSGLRNSNEEFATGAQTIRG